VQDYVKLALDLAISKLAGKKISRERFIAETINLFQLSANAPPDSFPIPEDNVQPKINVEQLILDGMTQLSPGATNGALVSLTELRQWLMKELPGKNNFDQIVLELAETGRFALHTHDYPTSLTQEERDGLVKDGRDNYYIGIALRE